MVFASESGLPIKILSLTLTYPANVTFGANPIHITDENGVAVPNARIDMDLSVPGSLILIIANVDTPDSALTTADNVIVSIDMDISSGSVDQNNFKVTNVMITDIRGSQTDFPIVDYTVTIS